jgi:hypothetical protein
MITGDAPEAHHRFRWAYDAPPPFAPQQGAGSVHRIAWAKVHAHLRNELERTLTPLVNPRTARRGAEVTRA